jgi:hypothetical protein
VVAPLGAWSITLDFHASGSTGDESTYYREATGMIARYRSPNRLQFRIFKAGFFERLFRRLAGRPVEIGDPQFDRTFLVTGSDSELVGRLFSNTSIGYQVSTLLGTKRSSSWIHFGFFTSYYNPARGWASLESKEVAAHSGTTVNELRYVYEGTIDDVALLRQVHHLLHEILQELVRIGCAVEEPA